MRTLLAVIIGLALISSVGVCFAQTQLVSDDFTSGTNGTYLGSNWTGCGFNNGAYNVLVYENGAAGGSGFWAQDCALYIGYGAFPSDQYVTATIAAATPSSSPQSSIQLRSNATPSTPEAYVACGWDAQDFPPDYHYRIWSLAPNSPGPVSLWLSNIVPATNDVISCQILGNTLTMQVNGSPVATVIDPSGNNNGYPGLYYVDPNGTGPTTSDIIFSNFAAGNGPPLVSVNITPPSTTAVEGSFVQFTGIATYADGSTSNMNNWSSSDPTVATVDASGFAYGIAPGTVTITGASAADSGTATLVVQASNGYTPLVHDSFTGTGGGYLGTNWVGCGFDGGSYSQLVYQNNQAGGSGYYSQNCSLYTGYGVFPNDQYATAMVVAPNPAGTTEASIQIRGNATPSSPESYIACGWDAQDFPADYHYRIWSLPPNPSSGGPTSLYLSNVVPATNDVVWCQVMGTTVTMQVNGTTIGSVTDTSGITSGYPGMYYIDLNPDVPPVTDVIFDNFVAGQINGKVLSSIAVTPNPATVQTGSNLQFTATGTYTDLTTANITSSVIWASSNPSTATVNTNGLASAVNAGTVTISATSGSTNGSANLTVNGPITPTVTFTGVPASAPDNGTFTVTATTNSSVMPTITGTAGICSVGTVTGTSTSASAVVTMLAGTGTCTVTANWAATTNYTAAGPLTQTTTASMASPTVTFSGAPASAPNNGTFTVTATTNASVMPTIAGTAGICSVGTPAGTPSNASALVTMLGGAGTCTMTANWAADSNYSAAGPLTQATAANAIAPTVSFSGAPASAPYNGTFTVTATTNASVMPTITGTAGVCSVGGVTGTSANANAVVTMLSGTGTCTVSASWAATSTYAAAGPLTQSTAASAIAPTVTFTGAPASSPYKGTFTVTATTNASVMPAITGTAGVCSVGTVTGTSSSANAVVTMLSGTGTCTVSATWAASSNYSAAGPLTQTTNASLTAPTVTFTGAPASAGYYSSFNVTATTNASTMPQITGTANICSVGTVSGTPASASAAVTMLSNSGTCTLTATWAGDANYSAPAPKTQTTTATKAATTTSITSNTPNPSGLQQAVTINFSVPGGGSGPTGSVTVTASTKETCTGNLNSAHTGSCSITFTTGGTRTLTATYGGDTNFTGSTSSSVSQTVNSPTVSLSPPSINYGSVTRGSTQTKTETVSNTGTGALVNFSWSITGANSNQFSVTSTTCGTTLNAGASCTFSVTFSPNVKGTLNANLRLADSATNSPQNVALSGSGK